MEQTFRTCFGALPISSTRFCAEHACRQAFYVLAIGLHSVKRKLDGHTKACDWRRSPKASSLAICLFSVFRAKFAYETLVHANRFLVPIDFPLSCVDPRAAIPALAMLHL